jgi:hypothetical protein
MSIEERCVALGMYDDHTTWLEKFLTAKVKLQEQQLTIATTALDKLSRLGNEPHVGNSIGNDMAKEALVSILSCAVTFDIDKVTP